MLKIYGIDLSPPANKVRYVANWLELAYEYSRVDMAAGENQTETYLDMHPAGKVPVLDDDGFIVFESDAIIRYLADRESSELYPRELKARAVVDEWLGFGSSHVGEAMVRVLFNRIIYRFVGVEASKEILESGLELLDRFLPVVDARLSRNRYLAGQQLSLADFGLLSALDPAEVCNVSLGAYAHLRSWRNQLKQEAFYQHCFGDYSELFSS